MNNRFTFLFNSISPYIARLKTVSQTQSSDVRVRANSLDPRDLSYFLNLCCCDSLKQWSSIYSLTFGLSQIQNNS